MIKDITRGVFTRNPVFVILLGVCPALAVTSRFINAMTLGACVLTVLVGAGILVSLLRSFIPVRYRVPAVLLILTSLVTIVDLVLQAWAPALAAGLGIYLPLIAVNCLILGRAESVAFTRAPGAATLDALGMGSGFILALGLIAFVREIIGSGTVTLLPLPAAGLPDGIIRVPGLSDSPVAAVAAPIGAFLAVGFLTGLANVVGALRHKMKSGRRPPSGTGTSGNDAGAERGSS